MVGIDYSIATIAMREWFSFTKAGVQQAVQDIAQQSGVLGAVLLSTCNRTELYLSLEETANADPGQLLCAAAGHSHTEVALVTRDGEYAIRHLMEVAAGLKSQILGEDQILAQVKTAAELAREAGTCDSVLSTLFRTAVSCGKRIKTGGRLTGVATSAAHLAVKAAQVRMGTLTGKRALVIGNGEMGRLAASLLRDAGCSVSVTLRSYHHGETVVPAGCAVTPYEERYGAIAGVDLVVSATTSPHYTVLQEEFEALPTRPSLLIDLSIPRDIQPSLGEVPDVCLLNVDDLGHGLGADAAALQRAEQAIAEYLQRFHQWATYRESLPAMGEVKQVLRSRISTYLEEDMDSETVMDLTIEKVVDLLAGSMTEAFNTRALRRCSERIRVHTR